MNRSEVATLLGLAAARDRRTVGQADVAAWLTDIGDLDFAHAKLALERHFRESTDWLMPAHIRRLVREVHDERRRAEHHEVRTLASRFEDDVQRAVRVERGLAQCADILGPIMAELNRRRHAVGQTADDPSLDRARERARRERKGRRA